MKTLDLPKQSFTGIRRPPWRDRLDTWLDRWMTSQTLYQWTSRNVLTRWVTRRRAKQVFDLMAGFVYTQVLLACVRLKILEMVCETPRTLQELANQCQVPASALQRLLESARALGLLEWRGGQRYGLGPLGAPVAGHAGIRAMIEHHSVLYQDMSDPVALLTDTLPAAQMAEYWPYAKPRPTHANSAGWQADKIARYSELMSASQPFVVDEVLASYAFAENQCVLDVGGGQGTFIGRLAKHAPHLKLKLFDLPQVADLARQKLSQQALAGRLEISGGDFLKDDLPQGADLVTLIRIAHDHPDDHVRKILAAIYKALPVGGTLLLAEPMAQDAEEEPLGDAYFHFYLLAMGSGRLRTVQELMDMMAEAGFSHLEPLPNPMPLQTRILLGRKAKYLP
jgi:demethylspheroidene O-methyltransferase